MAEQEYGDLSQMDDDLPPGFNPNSNEGLTSAEAQARLLQYGRNELESKATSKWVLFSRQFTNPMAILIWIAIIVELSLNNWADFGVLLFLQCLNGGVGFHESAKASDAVEALKASLKPVATVKRDGKFQNINGGEVVPGDVVLLGSGSSVPADSIIIDGIIDVDQSQLTGESLPVTMEKGDKPKMGSMVTRGEVEGIVQFTGKNTFFGKTAALINTVENPGHFQIVLLRITKFLFCVSLVLVAICMIYLLEEEGKPRDAIAFGVVLLVASIPIAMQVVCTTTMALGSARLADHKAIVARLSSIEELAGMNLLCSDKTGTLTLNKMVLQEDTPVFNEGTSQADVVKYACLAAKWKEPPKDALDTLCLTAMDPTTLDIYTQVEYVPFDPAKKYTKATLKGPDGAQFECVKGAPQIVLAMCCNKEDIREQVEEKVHELASRGIRSLSVAIGPNVDELKMFGVLTFLDPPRPDTKSTIHNAAKLGVDVKMITGDHAVIAKETCRQLGMGDDIYKADGLPSMKIGEEGVPQDLGDKYGEQIENANGFAEVFPEHKFLIVEAMRQRGYTCGMTGDGVNDAPALKVADVGIAVEGATDAARAAADLILTAPGLSVIVEAITISRCIFQRMKNYVIYRVACTIQLLMFFFITVLSVKPKHFSDDPSYENTFELPVLTLVIITILNDGTIISIAYDHVTPSARPEKWTLPVLYIVSSILGLTAMVSSIVLLVLGLGAHEHGSLGHTFGLGDLEYKQILTLIYLKISLSDFLTVFSARTKGPFWERKPGGLLFAAAIFAMTISTLLSKYWEDIFGSSEMVGLDGKAIGFVWVYCFLWWLLQDAVKVVAYKYIYQYDIMGVRSDDEKAPPTLDRKPLLSDMA
ncbi:hypothetical protein CYMTET_15971 [Cymbomonas tetramitiformis]|uniref:Plasma membrane ATPase n=1 Tax=Cymbomonas tetramitiformis TaxID=36881 RepID=A0AAE0L8G1_9CHLO|nr:hypothetical protein CYMTET_15971 [Cymbomonas tetramitiformis]|eukprot:gene11319-13375_t